MALTSTTAFASSGHNHGSAKSVKIKGDCNVVGNNNTVHCTTVSHKHRGDNNGDFGRHHGGILEGVGDILGGVLGAL